MGEPTPLASPEVPIQHSLPFPPKERLNNARNLKTLHAISSLPFWAWVPSFPFRPVPSESSGDFGKGQETSTQCGQVQHCLGPHGSRQLLFWLGKNTTHSCQGFKSGLTILTSWFPKVLNFSQHGESQIHLISAHTMLEWDKMAPSKILCLGAEGTFKQEPDDNTWHPQLQFDEKYRLNFLG